jgi:beta-glucanase (GH16 family)
MRFTVSLLVLFLATFAVAQSPTFSDDFSAGKLDTDKWTISKGYGPGTVGNLTSLYDPANVDFSQGMLRIALVQTNPKQGQIVSTGGEIRSIRRFGFGKYGFTVRIGTTSSTPNGPGSSVSGGVTGLFSYYNNSQTEIDFEFLGSEPGNTYVTSWANRSQKKSPVFNQQTKVANLSDGFHRFEYVWKPGSIEFYIDGKFVGVHTKNVPSAPAFICIDHWGNNRRWGGTATFKTPRYIFVKNVTFTPLGAN